VVYVKPFHALIWVITLDDPVFRIAPPQGVVGYLRKNWIIEFLVVTEPGKYSKVIWVEA